VRSWKSKLVVLVAGISPLVALPAAAKDAYPNRPITFVAPIPAGGGTDVLARDIALRLQERLGQPVVVENRPGGAGSIGTAYVAKATPDGYTMLLINSSHSINPHVYKNLSFDPIKDFEPVVGLVDFPMVVAVNPKLPVNNLKEFVELAKAKPGEINFASSGNGGASHIAGELFAMKTGTKMTHVPYRGSAPSVADTISGQVSVTFSELGVIGPHMRSGALRVIGITADERSPAAPDVPTLIESGIHGVDWSTWVGILMPAGTPKEVVDRMNREVVAVLKEPEMVEKIESRTWKVLANSPEEFASLIKKDYDKFAEFIPAANITVQ